METKAAVTLFADGADQATATVAFECLRGEDVWVEAYANEELFGSELKYTLFTGHLLATI